MDLGQIDFDRVLFYEHARMDAEAAYAKNPLDAENLTTWGKALLELSQFQNPSDSLKFVKDAASKMEEALQIDPRKHDALWGLGNAHTSHALFLNDLNAATIYFGKATQCFQKALEEDPGNEIYMKSLEFSTKAPELHMEIHRQMANQPDAGRHSSTSNTKVSKTKNKSDLKYDILGWVILAVGIVAWVGLAKHHIPTPPPAPRMAKSGDCKVNAVWERDVLLTFCDLCLKEINAGNRPTTHFNREGWANLVRSFGETTGRDYDKIQLKNKWDHLKKEWKLWKELKKDDTGLGWDSRRKTIDAPPEWWAEKLKIMPEAKKFRLSGIDPELEDKLDQMYGDVVATGKDAFVPTGDHAFVPTNDITTNVEGEGSSDDVSTQALPSDNAERIPNCEKNTTSNNRGSKKRKKGVTMMRGQISELIDSCNAIASEHSSRHVQPPLSQAIKLLEEMPEVAEDFEFFMHSTQLLEDDKKREIFMTIKPEKKLRFLRFYYASRHE